MVSLFFYGRYCIYSVVKQYPRLEFADQAWHMCTSKDEMFENVQRKTIGIAFGLLGKICEGKLEELDMTLEERRHNLGLVQLFKIVSGY